MYAWLSDSLAHGNTVLTASRRLARELRQAYDAGQLAAANRSWLTPDIHYVNDWLAKLLQGGSGVALSPLRIDAQTSTVLWERCVAKCMDDGLPGFPALVRQCRQAWTRLQYWQVPAKELAARATIPEHQQYAAAARHYSAALSRRNWVDDAGLFDAVAGLVGTGIVEVPAAVCLAGFDRVWPALEHLLNELREAGTTVRSVDQTAGAGSVTVTSHDDMQAELRAAGAWARQQLARSPTAKIAIICPDLENNASHAARLVREGFAPGWQYAGSRHRGSVNVSYGRPLTDFPAIAVALMLLRWVHGPLSSREVSILLRSRSIVGGAVSARCRKELQLRFLPDREWSPAKIIAALASEASADDAEVWSTSIQHLDDARVRYRGKRSPAEWAEAFDQLLTDAGWPGAGLQDSDEFQLLNRWRDLLNELARLQKVLPVMGFRDAVSRLSSLAVATIFQPESAAGVVPVIGTLEAAGMQFDKIWVTGFDAGRWPASGNPLTFVSSQLQQDYGLPDATPQDSLAFSRRVVQRLLHSAGDIVLSWACAEDGVEQQPSPLLQEIEGVSDGDFVDPGWHARAMINSKLLCQFTDDVIPPTSDDEKIRGGAYTVQQQSSDPFAAFAYGRLRVKDLQQFQPGLSASLRGSMIHNTLSHIYAGKPSQSDIQRWGDAEWLERIETAARRSMTRHARHADPALHRIIELERRRIAQILMRFSVEERNRENFRIEMIEQEFDYGNFGVRLSLRVDRVDRMDDESLLIIDYKTGAEKALLNRDGNLRDLQLMVYALVMADKVGGVGLMNLDSRKISFKRTKVADDWHECLAGWTRETEATIKSLGRGDARVNMALNTEQARPLNVLSRFEELRRE